MVDPSLKQTIKNLLDDIYNEYKIGSSYKGDPLFNNECEELVNLINNELFMKEDIDEFYEKTCSLFYNVSFIPGDEIQVIKYYLEIHIETFLIYFIVHKYKFKTINNENMNLY